jgi:hypothetical protein
MPHQVFIFQQHLANSRQTSVTTASAYATAESQIVDIMLIEGLTYDGKAGVLGRIDISDKAKGRKTSERCCPNLG